MNPGTVLDPDPDRARNKFWAGRILPPRIVCVNVGPREQLSEHSGENCKTASAVTSPVDTQDAQILRIRDRFPLGMLQGAGGLGSGWISVHSQAEPREEGRVVLGAPQQRDGASL